MVAFASGLSQHPVPSQATGEVAGEVLEQLDGERPDLVVCFASIHHVGAFDDIAAALRRILEPAVLLGATASCVIGSSAGGAHEVEGAPALSVFAASLPETRLEPIRALPEVLPSEGVLVLLADPFSFGVDEFLADLRARAPGVAVVGGLASAAANPGGNRLVLDGSVTSEGAIGVLLEGGVGVRTLVSQGCRPIGRPFIVTRAEGGLVLELGGQPAVTRLQELASESNEEERELIRRGLHVGLVVDEHQADFGSGDFLVRNLLGADPNSGALVIGEAVAVGQTLQFHVRDATAADDELNEILAGKRAAGALLFTCTGRGERLFGAPDHDAGVLTAHLGPIPLAGAFCAGEIGPVGSRSYVHTFTASVALFGERPAETVSEAGRAGT